MIAAHYNQCEVVEILIAAQADLNAKTGVTVPRAPLAAADSVLVDFQNSWTALHAAADSNCGNHCHVAKLLIAAGANVNATAAVTIAPLAPVGSLLVGGQNDDTPLHVATYADHGRSTNQQNMVKLIKAAGGLCSAYNEQL